MSGSMDEAPRGRRIPLRLRVRYATVDQFLIDYTENIRRGGSFVRTKTPLQPGTRLYLEIEVAGVPVFIKLRGRVSWVNDPGGDWHRKDLQAGMGVRFIFSDETSRLMLENLVGRLEREPMSRKKSISPRFLAELIEKLRPDIQQLVKEKSSKSDLLSPHIRDMLNNGGYPEGKKQA